MSWSDDSWTIGRVILQDGIVISKLPPGLIDLLPPGLPGITDDSDINSIIIALSKEIERLGNQRLGSTIGIGSDGRPVVQIINDIMLVAESTSYTAGLVSDYGKTVYNVFTNGNVTALSNFLAKRGGTTIKLFVNNVETGSVQIPNNENTSAITSTGALRVINDEDPFPTNSALATTTRAIKLRIIPGSLSPGQYNYYLTSTDGTSIRRSIPYSFYVDRARTSSPLVRLARINNFISGTTRFISGVPRLNAGSQFNLIVTFDSTLFTDYYNISQTITVTSDIFNTTSYLVTSANLITASSSPTVTVTIPVSIGNNRYTLLQNGTVTIWDYTGPVATTPITSYANLAADTVSLDEGALRVKSGNNDFPTVYGGAFDSTEVLSLNSELQLLNGLFVYPRVNHSGFYPEGPNYSLINTPSTRWMTKKITYSPAQLITRGQLQLLNCNDDMLGAADANELKIYINPGNDIWYSAIDEFDPADTTLSNGHGAVEYGAYGDVMEGNIYKIPITFGGVLTVTNMFIRVGISNDSLIGFGDVIFNIVSS